MAKLLVLVLVLYATVVVVAMLSQTRALFPTDAVASAGPLPAGAERLTVATADGQRLHGIYFPPAIEPAAPRTLMLGFGGNAWNGQDVAVTLHELYPEQHVVAFHYRGYRPSTGSPSAEALLADAPLVHDAAVARVKPDRVIAAGFSIGSGIAAGLARDRPLAGLILVTPFDSLKAVAAGLFPWLPVGPLFANELATADYLADSPAPVAIVAAEHDEIVPPARTDALRARLRHLAFDRTIAGAGHNDLYARPEFGAAMADALRALSAGPADESR